MNKTRLVAVRQSFLRFRVGVRVEVLVPRCSLLAPQGCVLVGEGWHVVVVLNLGLGLKVGSNGSLRLSTS